MTNETTATKTQVTAGLQMLQAIAEAIRESGPRGIPSGHIYSMLMARMSIEAYDKAIGILKGAGLIMESMHVLTWKLAGPIGYESGRTKDHDSGHLNPDHD